MGYRSFSISLAALTCATLIAAAPETNEAIHTIKRSCPRLTSPDPHLALRPTSSLIAKTLLLPDPSSPQVTLTDGAAEVQTSAYTAHVAQGAMTITALRAPRPLTYRLSRVATSQVFYEDSTATPELALEGTARILCHRASFDEVYDALDSGLEQSFRFPERPSGTGDLEIRGQVTTELTPPAEGTSNSSLSFRDGEKLVVLIDHCVVVDASGSELPLALTYESGEVVIRVPEAWLAQATFPVTVDPLIGTAVSVDTALTDLFARPIDIAYNATNNEYLVVWNEEFSSPDFDVFAQRINGTTGALVGTTITIDISADTSGECAVAWRSSSNEYLIVYYDDDTITGCILPGTSSTAGTPFIIDSDVPGTSNFSANPDVVASPSGWRAVWETLTYDPTTFDVTEGAIWGRDITGSGTFGGGSFLVQNVTGTIERRPTIAFNSGPNNYLIGWDTNYTTPGESLIRTATTAATPTLGAVATVSTADTSASGAIRIAANHITNQYLCVWQDDVSSTDGEIHAQLVTSTGTPSGSQFTVPPTNSYDARPDVAWNSTNNMYLIVHHSLTVDSTGTVSAGDVNGATYDGTSLALQEPVAFAGSAVEFWPSIASRSSGAEALTAWVGAPTGTGPYSVNAQRYGFPASSGGGGGGGRSGGGGNGREGINGDQGINDLLCSVPATSSGTAAVWFMTALISFAALTLRRRSR